MAQEWGVCSQAVDGIGYGGCLTSPVMKKFKKIVLAKDGQSFASLTEFDTESNWLTDIANLDLLPLPNIESSEDTSTEDVKVTTDAGTVIFMENGKYGFKVKMKTTPDQNRIMATYNGSTFKAYIIDVEGTRMGTADGDGVKGFTMSYHHVDRKDLPLTSETPEFSVMEFQFENIDEFNKYPRYAIGSTSSWSPLTSIKPATKIVITPSTVDTNEFTFTAAYVDPTTGASIPRTGIVVGDLTVYDQAGAAVSGAVVESSTVPGTYTYTGTMTSGSIKLNASASSLVYSDTTTLTAA